MRICPYPAKCVCAVCALVYVFLYGIIEQTPRLAAEFTKKLESKGFQELQFTEGRRYIVRANNSAGRGIAAPETIHLDEAREYKDEDVWSALRYTQMASPNPQISPSASQESLLILFYPLSICFSFLPAHSTTVEVSLIALTRFSTVRSVMPILIKSG